MTQEKKSFVLYFDSWPLIATLPPEQRGWLLSAVFDFAIRVLKTRMFPRRPFWTTTRR